MLLNLMSFFDWVVPAEKSVYGCNWDPTPERSIGFPGARD